MIIYKSTNKVNDKSYIGQTVNKFRIRKAGHRHDALRRKTNSYFHKAIRKYGWDNFTWEIICECSSKEELDEMEFHYIKQYKCREYENGYNLIDSGGSGMWGLKHTEETKRKISNGNKGKMTGDKNPACRPEVRKKISESRMGQFKGRENPFYGKSHTDEMIQFFKESQLGSKSKMSKTYKITYPDGHTEIIKGLKQFCRRRCLNLSGMFAVANGRQKTTGGGYRCEHYSARS